MTLPKRRRLLLLIHETRYKPSRICNRQLQRRCSSALVVASGVVTIPGKNARYRRIHSRSHEERHTVLYFGVRGLANNSIPDNSYRKCTQHDRSTKVEAIRQQRNSHRENRSHGVRDDCPELRLIGVLSEAVVDDCGQKEAEGVETTQNTKIRQRREPDLDVEDAALDFGPIEAFVG
jgi:hypothetical protein